MGAAGFHSAGFSAKKVRTSSKNCRNFAKISTSVKNGDTGAEFGGQGDIPPLTQYERISCGYLFVLECIGGSRHRVPDPCHRHKVDTTEGGLHRLPPVHGNEQIAYGLSPFGGT